MDRSMSLDIREFVAVDAVARTRSFKRAAEALFTSQPTLSRLISSAEEKLGVVIFDRGWSGAETTSEGDVVARYCAHVVAALDTAQARLFAKRPNSPSLRTNLRSKQIDVVEAICRHGSVTQASHALNRSQSDLSRCLSDLAKRFDVGLFVRTGTGMAPEPGAMTLAELAGHIAYFETQMRAQLRLLEADIVGRVSVGLLAFSGQDFILKTFGSLANDYPHVRLTAVPGSYNGLVEALRRREIDRIVGIGRGDDCEQGLIEEPLYHEHFAVIARRDHPLHNHAHDTQQLARTNWIVAPHGTPARAYFETAFAKLGVTPPTQTCQLLSFGNAEQMLIHSNSVAVLTYSEKKLNELPPELAKVDTSLPPSTTPIVLTKLAGIASDPALAEFDARLKNVVRADL